MAAVFIPPRPETAWAVVQADPDERESHVVVLVLGWVLDEYANCRLVNVCNLHDEPDAYAAVENWNCFADEDVLAYFGDRRDAHDYATQRNAAASLRRELADTTG
jgi:hypothetical protein